MADQTTTVPGVGKVPKKELTIGLVIVGTLIVVYYVRSKSSTPAPVATPANQYPADGTTGNPSDPYSTDPATGQTYGDEATGSGGTYGAYGTGAASGLYYDPATGAYDLTSPYGTNAAPPTGTVANGPPFSTNAQWSNWAIAQMVANNSQQDPGALTDALGLYLGGQPVDTSQQQLIFDAIAVAGDPPVAGANGYPPNVQLNGNKGGATYTPPAGETVIGTGYNAGAGSNLGSTVTGNDGHVYTWVTPAQAQAADNAGQQLYYQAQPGLFIAGPPGAQLGTGTPLYTRS